MSRKQEKQEKKEQKIKIEKTLLEHAADGLVHILKQLGVEDEKQYYVMKDVRDGGELNTITLVGSEEEMQVDGRARVGFFDQSKNNQHYEGKKGKGIDVTYQYTGKIIPDNWGIKGVSIAHFNLEGLDAFQKEA